MNILIAYDGSGCSDAALDDLKVAGLPDDTRAHIMSVAEVWLPPPDDKVSFKDYINDLQSKPQPFAGWKRGAKLVAEAEAMAHRAAKRVHKNFPLWIVTSSADYGSPAYQLLTKATELKADLIVVGSHGRNALERLFLGSVSQKLLTEAECSVRIARGKIEIDPAPARIVIGYDGTSGADAAVESVASRDWREGSEARLAVIMDGRLDDEDAPDQYDFDAFANSLAEKPWRTLERASLQSEVVADTGNPKDCLVELAERWGANSIFVGANKYGSRVERFLLGSVSAAVAARAHCSVEVVRKIKGDLR